MLVVGVIEINGGTVVNNSQMRVVCHKVKSTINGSLEKLGYSVIALKSEVGSKEILDNISCMILKKNN